MNLEFSIENYMHSHTIRNRRAHTQTHVHVYKFRTLSFASSLKQRYNSWRDLIVLNDFPLTRTDALALSLSPIYCHFSGSITVNNNISLNIDGAALTGDDNSKQQAEAPTRNVQQFPNYLFVENKFVYRFSTLIPSLTTTKRRKETPIPISRFNVNIVRQPKMLENIFRIIIFASTNLVFFCIQLEQIF